LSRTTHVSQHQKGKTRKDNTNLDLQEQEIVSGRGISCAICNSALRPRQIIMPALHHSVFYRPDALPAFQPTASKHWTFQIIREYMNKKSQSNLGRAALLPHMQAILLATMGCPTFTLKTAPSHRWYLLSFNTPILWLTPLTTSYGIQIQSAILWLSRLITPCDNSTATSTYTQPSIKFPIGNHKLPQIHMQNCPLPFDDHHQKSNMPVQRPT